MEDATELGGRSDWAEGRRAGYVFIDPVTEVPDDLELWLMVLARELASRDNFDWGLPTSECSGVGD